MKTIKDLKFTLPQTGSVKWIGVRPQRRSDTVSLQKAKITLESGLDGDHYSREGGKRMITLIQAEHLEAVSGFLNRGINPGLTRRNIVISGINLNALHDATFQLGEDVLLEGTGYCHPCSRMEENLGPGGYNAMRGHGGITAKVVRGGRIKIGDKVSLTRGNPS